MLAKKSSLTLLVVISILFMWLTAEAADDEGVKPDLAFGVIADVQYCDGDSMGSRFYRQSLGKLDLCVSELNKRQLDFVVQLGDFIDRDFESFDKVLPLYGKLKVPHYHVLGNHDYSVDPAERTDVSRKLGLPGRYYDFAFRSWRFVVLDGNDLSLYAPDTRSVRYEKASELLRKVKQEGLPQAMAWNGGVGQEQLAWLEDLLGKAEAAGEKVIIFCHFPAHPANVHNLWNSNELIKVIESFDCVVAYMNGHNHHGNYAGMAGVHYVTFGGMVETEKETAYAVVEVFGDHLKITGSGREPDRLLAIREG